MHCAVKVGKISNACSTNGKFKIAQFFEFCALRPLKKFLASLTEIKASVSP